MTHPNAWQAPISLGVLEIRPFPKNVFPEVIEEFVVDLSRSTETPLDLAALTALSGIATAAHDKYIVQIKDDYCEPVNIWTAVALPPGSRKSAVQMAVIKPIVKYEAIKKEELEPLIKEQISKNKSLEVRIKEKRAQAAKADICDYEGLQKEILELEAKIEEAFVVPQLWTGDITAENLATLMAMHGGCMSILSDEAGMFDTLAGRYSGGIPNLDLFLKGHSGTPVRINRVGRPPDIIERPVLTIGLTPQPSVLRDLGKVGAFRGRGLLARFLYALPESNLGKRSLDAPSLSREIEQEYGDIITNILSHQLENNVLYSLRLSAEAYEAWRLYALVIEIKMDEGGQFAFMTDWAGKLPGQIVRIAALLHIARHAKEEPWFIEISHEDMKAAISIGGYLASHALATFDLIQEDPAVHGAKAVLRWIEKSRWQQFTFRDCHYAHKNRFKRVKDMEPCVDVLLCNSFIKELESEKKTGRPSRIFIVNPLIYQDET